jgi:hypothetical protein
VKDLFYLTIQGNCAPAPKGREMAVNVEILVMLLTLMANVLMVSDTGELNGLCQDLNQTCQYCRI